jgi:hypothetical protein
VVGEGEDEVAGEGEDERRAEAEDERRAAVVRRYGASAPAGVAAPLARGGANGEAGRGARVSVGAGGAYISATTPSWAWPVAAWAGGLIAIGDLWAVALGDDGPAGPSGPLGLVLAHEPHRAKLFHAVLGWHYGLELKPITARRRARAGPGPKISCWARARVGPNYRAMGRPMGLVLFGQLYLPPLKRPVFYFLV